MTLFSREIGPGGSPDAPYIIVGEAPGDIEVQVGKPSVGPAGKLLRQLLLNAGIKWEDCYLLNTIRKRPRPDIGAYVKLAGGRPFESEEFKQAVENLKFTIQAATGRIIIPVGNVAMWALLRERDIMKRRGSLLNSPDFPNRLIIPTLHPSAALRTYLFRYQILHDLNRAREEHERPRPVPSKELLIGPTFDEAMAYLELCEKQEMVAFDIETTRTGTVGGFESWEVSCLSFGVRAKDASKSTAVCIPFMDGDRNDLFTLPQEALIWKKITGILENPKIKVLGQNLMFDAAFLLRKYGIVIRSIEDTMLAQNIVNPDFPKGLDFLCSIYTREPYYKDEGKQHMKFGGNLSDFWRYSAKDSAVLFEIWDGLQADINRTSNRKTYEDTRDLYHPLLFMSEYGLPFNKDLALTAASHIREQINDLEQQINALVGYEINPRSPVQLKRFFYEECKLPMYRKKGSVTTSEEALKKIIGKRVSPASEVADLILNVRALEKLAGTYLEMETDADNRIRSSISPAITKTGRLSSRKTIFGTGGNVQNLPPSFKHFVTGDRGYVLYNADLAQAENRLVAFYAPEPRMQDAFDSGIDVHSLTGSMLSGLTIDEVKRENELGITCEIGPGTKTWRYWGKMCNHALNYGLGPRTFATRLEIPEIESRLLINRYHSAYPGVRQYHKYIQNRLSENRTIVNPFGRSRKFLDQWGDSLFKEAYAHLPQSTVADIINRWGILPIYYDQETFGQLVLLNQVHDSIVFQIPIDLGWVYHAEILSAIRTSVERPLEWRGAQTIIPLEIEMGLNMKDMKKIDLLVPGELERIWREINDGV